jgi:hypothetical protein
MKKKRNLVTSWSYEWDDAKHWKWAFSCKSVEAIMLDVAEQLLVEAWDIVMSGKKLFPYEWCLVVQAEDYLIKGPV